MSTSGQRANLISPEHAAMRMTDALSEDRGRNVSCAIAHFGTLHWLAWNRRPALAKQSRPLFPAGSSRSAGLGLGL